MDLKELKRLVDLFEKSSISELEIDEKGTKVRLRKGGVVPSEVSAYRHITHTPPTPHQATVTQTKTEEVTAGIKHKKGIPQGGNYVIVEPPMVGTFYRASSEGA